jgi:ribosomal protein L7/L12
LVDGCANEPKIVKENISWDEAESCGKKIEEQGATILIIGHGEDVYE